MITILTHSPHILSLENSKAKIKTLLRQKRGPGAVVESLRRGLTELGITYQVNPSKNNISETVHVMSGVGALRYAISLKKEGSIKKLIVGPNVVVFPLEHDSIMLDPAIDVILQPSDWVKNFYVSLDKKFESTVHVWPAGVADPQQFSPRKKNSKHCIIYQKNASPTVLEKIKETLKTQNIAFTILTYGSFKQQDFYDLLLKTDFIIYLSASESQGIALAEAWIRDVPTLVWSTGIWQSGTYTWRDPKISAPYLNDQLGMFFSSDFSSGDNFENVLEQFMNKLPSYKPRTYAVAHFIDRVCTETYIDILKSI